MPDPWHRRTWARVGGVILLLGLTVALAVPFLVPVDRFRPLVVRQIEAATGYPIQIDALRLYLVPVVHIHAANVRIKNPPGRPRGDAAVVKSIDIGVAPRALLSRKVEITYIAVKGVRANLVQYPDGRTNFDQTAAPQSVRASGRAPAQRGAPLLSLARIGMVTVRDVTITAASSGADRGQAAPSLTLSGVNARIRSIDMNAPDWPRKLDIEASLDRARLSTPSLAKPVQFQTGRLILKGAAGRAAFSASLDTVRANGTAVIAGLDPLSITFTIAVPELDLDRLERLGIGGTTRGASATRTPAAAGRTPTPRHLLARGEVNVDRLVSSPLEATRISGRLSVYTSAIVLDSFALSAYGGLIRGGAAVDTSAATLPLAATAQARGINLGRMVTTLSPHAKITGTLDADLRLATAVGRDPKAALTGAGTFAVRNGSFPGLDLKSSMAQMARVLQLNVPAGDTRFRYFGGDLRIARQRVQSSSLRLNGDDLDGTAGGSLGFDKTLDYTGVAVLKALASGASTSEGALPSVGQMLGKLAPGAGGATGAQVPFSLRGTLDDPKFSLAGTPQFIRNQSPQPPPSDQSQPPSLQDLFKLFR
ncbi:MAG TPA: AsmA family protein [bacterium]|nr:AsmA family protein [bacterium]